MSRLLLLALFVGGGLGVPSVHVFTHTQPLSAPAEGTHLHAAGADRGVTDAFPRAARGPVCVFCSAVFHGVPVQDRAFTRQERPADVYLPGFSRVFSLPVLSAHAIRGPPQFV